MIGAEDFSRDRHIWLRAVMGCHDLPATAKTVAYALVQEFANRETGRCNPPQADVAEFLGMSVRHLRDLIGALEERGFLRVFRGVGRGRPSFVRFIIPADAAYGKPGGGGKVVAFRQRADRPQNSAAGETKERAQPRRDLQPARVAKNRKCGVSKPELWFRVLKGTKENQDARAGGGGVFRASPGPQEGVEVIVREADAWPVECWRRWLRDQGLPDLRREADDGWIAEKQGWAMPSRYPPAAADAEGTGRAKAMIGGRAARAGGAEMARDRGAVQSIVQGFARAARAPSAAIGGRGDG